jgi:hypothetical protein
MADREQLVDSQPGVVDEERIPLSKMSLNALPGRTDTIGIVSAVMLALAMTGLLQFGERLDTLITGGLFPVAGRVIAFVLVGLGTAMFGAVPGLIVAWVNPFIATATGTSPIAPFFFLTNGLMVVAALLAGRLVRRNIVSFKYALVHTALAAVFLTLAYIPLHVLYFQLPVSQILVIYAVQALAELIATPILLFSLLRVIKSAGFVEE